MNQVRITLHVMASERGAAAMIGKSAIDAAIESDKGHSSGHTLDGEWRADIETITVPDDDETEPPFGTNVPHPVTAAEAGS